MRGTASEALAVRATVRSDVGRVREHNEDAYALCPELSLFAVADGMGGHAGGQIASRLAVEAVQRGFAESADDDLTPFADGRGGHSLAARRLFVAVHVANDAVWQASRDDPSLSGMGTTIAAVHLDARKEEIAICHVGDSRVYRVREDRLELLTRDHTVVQQLVDEGQLTSSKASTSRLRHALTQALGTGAVLSPSIQFEPVQPGDVYLLTSDGVHGETSPEEILECVRDLGGSLDALCDRLVALANAHGGRDNSTVIAVACDAAHPAPEPAQIGES